MNLRLAIGWAKLIGAIVLGLLILVCWVSPGRTGTPALSCEAVAAIIDYGFRRLGLATIRAYTDPSNAASQKVLLHCGLKKVGDIELVKPTRHGARRAPLFRISRPKLE